MVLSRGKTLASECFQYFSTYVPLFNLFFNNTSLLVKILREYVTLIV